MASHGLPQATPYHYKAFRLKVNQVGKYPTSWSLKKLPKTGVHALSSPCRTTSLLVLKESDGWIAYKSREKENTLSLKPNENGYWIFFLFFLLTFGLLLCFILPFCFSFLFSLFSSHFPFISPHFLFSFWSLSHPFWSHHTSGQREEIASPFPQIKGVTLPFPYFFFLFLNDIITTWLNMSHGIKSHTWLIVSHGIHATHVAQCEPFLFMPSVTLLRCHVTSPNLAICHPTPHASTNVKSRPPRNSTKFDVVAKFREMI